jgi:hypothetical protein
MFLFVLHHYRGDKQDCKYALIQWPGELAYWFPIRGLAHDVTEVVYMKTGVPVWRDLPHPYKLSNIQ